MDTPYAPFLGCAFACSDIGREVAPSVVVDDDGADTTSPEGDLSPSFFSASRFIINLKS